MLPNRTRSLDAAIEVLGNEGIHALTHLRVDRHAGLPRGSTSNAFRTRAALIRGVVEHMIAIERPLVEASFAPSTEEQLVDALAALAGRLVGQDRTRTAARLALYLEAARDPELRAALGSGRVAMHRAVVPALAALGAPDPQGGAGTIAVCFEGIFLHKVGGYAEIDLRDVLGSVVRGILSSSPPGSED